MANVKVNELSRERVDKVYKEYCEYVANGYKRNIIKHLLSNKYGVSEAYVLLIYYSKGEPSKYVTRSKNREI